MKTKTILAVVNPHAIQRLHERLNFNITKLFEDYGNPPVIRLIWNPIPASRGTKRIIVSLIHPITNDWEEAEFVLKKLGPIARKNYAKKRLFSDDEEENKKEWDDVKYVILTVYWSKDKSDDNRRLFDKRWKKRNQKT